MLTNTVEKTTFWQSMTSETDSEVKLWIQKGCLWKNNAFYSDPLEVITNGNRLLSYQYVFVDVLDCIFARGNYKHLRPTGRHKKSHADDSFSYNIYSQASADNIPLQITKKYAVSAHGLELARQDWEQEKIRRGCVINSSVEHPLSTRTTPATKDVCSFQTLDVNMITRECAFSFLQIWLSQVIHDSDMESERVALNILHTVAKLPRSTDNSAAYIQSIQTVVTSVTQRPGAHTSADTCTVLKNIYVLLIMRDLVQDLRYNWGCRDLYRLRLPIRYTISDGQMWENVFFPIIIASVPKLTFSRGSLAGIIALAEVLAHHVLEPNHDLATTLCTELVRRIGTHSLGYETALRATRAALTRWAFEQRRGEDRRVRDRKCSYDHGLDEPKEIVLPLLIRLRASIVNNSFNPPTLPQSLRLLNGAAAVCSMGAGCSGSRKRGRGDVVCGDENDDEEEPDDQVFRSRRKCSTEQSQAVLNAPNLGGDCELFTQRSLQTAAEYAKAVAATPGTVGAASSEDKLVMLNECILIIETVLQRRESDANRLGSESRKHMEPSTESGSDGKVDGDKFVDMVSDMLLDLQSLDLVGGLKDRDVVVAAMEKMTISRPLE